MGVGYHAFLIGSGLSRNALQMVGGRLLIQGFVLSILMGTATLAAILHGLMDRPRSPIRRSTHLCARGHDRYHDPKCGAGAQSAFNLDSAPMRRDDALRNREA